MNILFLLFFLRDKVLEQQMEKARPLMKMVRIVGLCSTALALAENPKHRTNCHRTLVKPPSQQICLKQQALSKLLSQIKK